MQLNFSDHIKLILCPHMGAVSYMDTEKNFHTFTFETLTQRCPGELYQKIRYSHEKLKKLLEKLSDGQENKNKI